MTAFKPIPSHLSPQEQRMIAQARRRIRWREAGRYDIPGVCRWCGKLVPRPSRFCGAQECYKQVRIRSEPQFARKCVGERDRGVCAHCRCDTVKLYRVLRTVERLAGYSMASAVFVDLGFTGDYRLNGNRWQMDHIKPVVEGGGGCGLENLRTLCTPCHRQETAALAKRRADKRFMDRLDLIVP